VARRLLCHDQPREGLDQERGPIQKTEARNSKGLDGFRELSRAERLTAFLEPLFRKIRRLRHRGCHQEQDSRGEEKSQQAWHSPGRWCKKYAPH
jgi:hypothetical protein